MKLSLYAYQKKFILLLLISLTFPFLLTHAQYIDLTDQQKEQILSNSVYIELAYTIIDSKSILINHDYKNLKIINKSKDKLKRRDFKKEISGTLVHRQCNGVIVDPYTILTSISCIKGIDNSLENEIYFNQQRTFVLNENDHPEKDSEYKIENIKINKKYKLALVYTTEKMDQYKNIEIESMLSADLFKKTCYLAGHNINNSIFSKRIINYLVRPNQSLESLPYLNSFDQLNNNIVMPPEACGSGIFLQKDSRIILSGLLNNPESFPKIKNNRGVIFFDKEIVEWVEKNKKERTEEDLLSWIVDEENQDKTKNESNMYIGYNMINTDSIFNEKKISLTLDNHEVIGSKIFPYFEFKNLSNRMQIKIFIEALKRSIKSIQDEKKEIQQKKMKLSSVEYDNQLEDLNNSLVIIKKYLELKEKEVSTNHNRINKNILSKLKEEIHKIEISSKYQEIFKSFIEKEMYFIFSNLRKKSWDTNYSFENIKINDDNYTYVVPQWSISAKKYEDHIDKIESMYKPEQSKRYYHPVIVEGTFLRDLIAYKSNNGEDDEEDNTEDEEKGMYVINQFHESDYFEMGEAGGNLILNGVLKVNDMNIYSGRIFGFGTILSRGEVKNYGGDIILGENKLGAMQNQIAQKIIEKYKKMLNNKKYFKIQDEIKKKIIEIEKKIVDSIISFGDLKIVQDFIQYGSFVQDQKNKYRPTGGRLFAKVTHKLNDKLKVQGKAILGGSLVINPVLPIKDTDYWILVESTQGIEGQFSKVISLDPEINFSIEYKENAVIIRPDKSYYSKSKNLLTNTSYNDLIQDMKVFRPSKNYQKLYFNSSNYHIDNKTGQICLNNGDHYFEGNSFESIVLEEGTLHLWNPFSPNKRNNISFCLIKSKNDFSRSNIQGDFIQEEKGTLKFRIGDFGNDSIKFEKKVKLSGKIQFVDDTKHVDSLDEWVIIESEEKIEGKFIDSKKYLPTKNGKIKCELIYNDKSVVLRRYPWVPSKEEMEELKYKAHLKNKNRNRKK